MRFPVQLEKTQLIQADVGNKTVTRLGSGWRSAEPSDDARRDCSLTCYFMKPS
jgi:hypothetical protein